MSRTDHGPASGRAPLNRDACSAPVPGRLPSRRDVLTLGIGAFLVASVPLTRRLRGRTLVRRRIPAMGTVAEVAVLHEDERYGQLAIDAALAEIRRTEDLLTRFRPTSDVGRVNETRPGLGVPVHEETASALALALRLAASSGGRFDPCLGKAVRLWDVGHRSAPPDSEAVQRFADRRLHSALEVDRMGGATVVRLHAADVAIDLGGIGKGWGVDRAVEALRAWGVRNGLVSLGGDLYALGESQDGDAWKIGVRDPDDPSGIHTELPLSDGALATSGDYEQYFSHGGRRYHHILDPRTGEPAQTTLRTVTVAHTSCAVADACATALFSSAPGEALRVLAQTDPEARLVHAAAGPPGATAARDFPTE